MKLSKEKRENFPSMTTNFSTSPPFTLRVKERAGDIKRETRIKKKED